MSRPYQLAIFDWEGTLGDTLGPVLHVIRVEASRLNFGDFDEWVARNYVVLGLPLALKKLFPYLTTHQQEQLLQSVQQALTKAPVDACLIPGALNVVQRMREFGMDLAIATNKGQQSLVRALHSSGLSDYFKVTRCAGQVPAKPCPKMLEEIIEEFGVSPSETVMIGDSLVDIEMANFAKVDAIGVDFEHTNAENLRAKGAIAVFDDYQKLADYFKLPILKG